LEAFRNLLLAIEPLQRQLSLLSGKEFKVAVYLFPVPQHIFDRETFIVQQVNMKTLSE
jgi:hypothetical protein